MEHIGMDLGKRESQIAILTEDGELVEKRIRTERPRLGEVFGSRPRARVLLEAATESEWVARCLEALGHEVVVADPNYAPMYAHRTRRVKTDRRDARALVHACKSGTYKPAHRTSEERRPLRALLGVREGVVRTRARWIGLSRALLRREGVRVRSGAADTFLARVAELEAPASLRAEIAPLLKLFAPVNEQIKALDEQLAALVHADTVLQRLTTVPGVGPVTAVSFVATVDDVRRFRRAHQVQSYLGLVPREWSSSETQRRGRITKVGNSRTRWLLVEAAWAILGGRKKPDTAPLREWAEGIRHRRGKQIAAVALARRLAGILYAMWRDRTEYDPDKLRRGGAAQHAA
ncbi:MAG: IS110 family transposase [Nitrospinota bacterium]